MSLLDKAIDYIKSTNHTIDDLPDVYRQMKLCVGVSNNDSDFTFPDIWKKNAKNISCFVYRKFGESLDGKNIYEIGVVYNPRIEIHQNDWCDERICEGFWEDIDGVLFVVNLLNRELGRMKLTGA